MGYTTYKDGETDNGVHAFQIPSHLAKVPGPICGETGNPEKRRPQSPLTPGGWDTTEPPKVSKSY